MTGNDGVITPARTAIPDVGTPRLPRQRRRAIAVEGHPAGPLPGNGICLAIEVEDTISFGGTRPGPDSLNALIEAGRAGVRTIAITQRMPAELAGWFDDADQLEVLSAGGAIHLPTAAGRNAALVRAIPADLTQRIVRELVLIGESVLLEYADHRVLVGDAGSEHFGLGGCRPGPIPLTRLDPGTAPRWAGVVRLVIGSSRRWAGRLRRVCGERCAVLPRPDGTLQVLAAGCTPAASLQRLLSPEGSVLHSADNAAPEAPAMRGTHRASFAGRTRRSAGPTPRPLLVVCGSSTHALSMISVAEIGVVVGDGLAGIDRLRHVRRVPAFDRRAAGGIRTAVRKAMRHLHERPEMAG